MAAAEFAECDTTTEAPSTRKLTQTRSTGSGATIFRQPS
jgi:hypothetical protein